MNSINRKNLLKHCTVPLAVRTAAFFRQPSPCHVGGYSGTAENRSSPQPLTPRSGSTLTEVLISILIMSIGIISIATMFPLSMLRTVKATQLTRATDLRYNAEALLDMNSRMIVDPDLDGIANSGNFIIDPFGTPGLPAALQPNFGNTGIGTPYTAVGRYTFGRAGSFVTAPDSWDVVHEGEPLGPVFGGGMNVSNVQTSGLATAANVLYRCALFDTAGQCVFRNLSEQIPHPVPTTPNRIEWAETVDANLNGALDQFPLPSGFTPTKVRIEAQQQRYSWFLTVRKTGFTADVDLVVCFNRTVDNPAQEEHVWNCPAWISGTSIVNVTTGGGTLKHNARKGGFMFDVDNARWYRISRLDESNPAQLVVTLETPTVISSPVAAAGGGHAMFPTHIIDVYPLGTRSYRP